MKGLELSRAYFEEYGLPMLREQFPDWVGRIAAGLIGSGSECFGFDDAISQDHDFEAGFCLFLPGERTARRPSAWSGPMPNCRKSSWAFGKAPSIPSAAAATA